MSDNKRKQKAEQLGAASPLTLFSSYLRHKRKLAATPTCPMGAELDRESEEAFLKVYKAHPQVVVTFVKLRNSLVVGFCVSLL